MKPKDIHFRYALATLLGVAPIWLALSDCLSLLRGVRSAEPATIAKNTLPPLSATTLRDLLAVEQSRLKDFDIVLMNLLCAEGLPNAERLDIQNRLAVLDGWASRVRSETQRHYYRFQRSPSQFEHSEGYFRMLMMAVVLYEDFNVRYNPERIANLEQAAMGDGFFADSRDLFLHGLLGSPRMGTCSSMPVLYVALGRRLGYPVKLVTTKAHLFVRWESPAERFNVDATSKGLNRYDDDYYRNWPFPLSDAEIEEHGYLKSLSAAEELAVFLSTRAQCLMEAGRYADATTSFEHALRLRPTSPDLKFLLAHVRTKCDCLGEPPPSIFSATAVVCESYAYPMKTGYAAGSEFVPDPNPLRQIR